MLCPSFTFVATANAIRYCGATPIFLDSEADTWNLCPARLREAIEDRLRAGKKPKALLLVHLYGMPARLAEILALAAEFEIPILEDAAEALGSRWQQRPLGSFGRVGVFSFNGNKILTTSGGGALVTHDPALAARARFLASQAKDPAPHYQHSEVGYNYRLSNLLAGIGRGQMELLPDRVKRRREIFQWYQEHLAGLPGLALAPYPRARRQPQQPLAHHPFAGPRSHRRHPRNRAPASRNAQHRKPPTLEAHALAAAFRRHAHVRRRGVRWPVCPRPVPAQRHRNGRRRATPRGQGPARSTGVGFSLPKNAR